MLGSLLVLSVLTAPPPGGALQVLRKQCQTWAANPGNPWALAHGVKTFGAAFMASDGRRATEVIVHDFLRRAPGPDGGVTPGVFGYPAMGAGGSPIEPHSNLNTKAMVCEAGLPLSTRFQASWGPVTLGELVESVKRGLRPRPAEPEYFRDLGWTLDVLAATQKPGATWKNVDGAELSADAIFDEALAELERETADLAQGLAEHRPQVDKRKQGIYAHPCGGLHFVQGVLAWARHPTVRQRWGARVDAQVAIHFYRLESERRQYDAALVQAEHSAPQFVVPVLVQMVKFYGHFLETAGRFRSDLKWKPDAAQLAAIGEAKRLLAAAVEKLEQRHVFEQTAALETSQRQLYLDLIGDSCHAAHGLAVWP